MEDTTTSGALDPSGEAVAQPKAAPETNGTVKKGLCCFSTSKDPKDNFGSCLKDALRKTDRNVLRLSK